MPDDSLDDALGDLIDGFPSWVRDRLRGGIIPTVEAREALGPTPRGWLANISLNPVPAGTESAIAPEGDTAAERFTALAATFTPTGPAHYPPPASPRPCPCGCGIDSADLGAMPPTGSQAWWDMVFGAYGIAPGFAGETASERFTRETAYVIDPAFVASRPPERPAPPSGDVLADIDAATEGRCGCGCGAPITDASPSAWFASADCQAQWHARHATDPADVYRRDDAGYGWIEDAARWRPDLATAEPRPLEPVHASLGLLLRRAPAGPNRRYAFGWDPSAHVYVLRLDDGDRYVEMAIDEGTIDAWFANWDTGAVQDAWERLDRQLTDQRLTDTYGHGPMPRCRSTAGHDWLADALDQANQAIDHALLFGNAYVGGPIQAAVVEDIRNAYLSVRLARVTAEDAPEVVRRLLGHEPTTSEEGA